MSSGFGLKGNISRCYPFFAEYKECLNQRETRKDGMVCYMAREDYFECLHSRKEKAMVSQVLDQEKLNASKENGGNGH